MYIRVRDEDEITKLDSFFTFINAKRRKGNQIVKFKLSNNNFTYFEDKLETKLISKNDLDLFASIPVFFISTKSESILIQSLNPDNFNFLTIDDISGEIIKVPVNDIHEEMDIILYDFKTNDYVIDEINFIMRISNEELKQIIPKMSKYILITEKTDGMIINNFMVI